MKSQEPNQCALTSHFPKLYCTFHQVYSFTSIDINMRIFKNFSSFLLLHSTPKAISNRKRKDLKSSRSDIFGFGYVTVTQALVVMQMTTLAEHVFELKGFRVMQPESELPYRPWKGFGTLGQDLNRLQSHLVLLLSATSVSSALIRYMPFLMLRIHVCLPSSPASP